MSPVAKFVKNTCRPYPIAFIKYKMKLNITIIMAGIGIISINMRFLIKQKTTNKTIEI